MSARSTKGHEDLSKYREKGGSGGPAPRSVRPPRLNRRQVAARVGLGAGVIGLGLILVAGGESFRAHGPLNTGHEDLACNQCHLKAEGTLRQQLQAEARHLLGLRPTPVDLGTRDVDSSRCLQCHNRPNERHPIYRFMEPRFAEVRASLAPQKCTSCHLEHNGTRLTATTTFCQNCHGDLELKNDPVDVPHTQLVLEERWDTCLGCHDFHGNHTMTSPTVLAERTPLEEITAYFQGGESPYPLPVIFPAEDPNAPTTGQEDVGQPASNPATTEEPSR